MFYLRLGERGNRSKDPPLEMQDARGRLSRRLKTAICEQAAGASGVHKSNEQHLSAPGEGLDSLCTQAPQIAAFLEERCCGSAFYAGYASQPVPLPHGLSTSKLNPIRLFGSFIRVTRAFASRWTPQLSRISLPSLPMADPNCSSRMTITVSFPFCLPMARRSLIHRAHPQRKGLMRITWKTEDHVAAIRRRKLCLHRGTSGWLGDASPGPQ